MSVGHCGGRVLSAFILLLTLAPQSFAVDTASAEPLARFEATFASLDHARISCQVLPLLFRDELDEVVPEPRRTKLEQAATSYDQLSVEVDRLRLETVVSRDALRMEALRVLRLVEESSGKVVEDLMAASYFTAMWHAAELAWKVSDVEDDLPDAMVDYYWLLWKLTTTEATLRKHVTSYYEQIATAFPVLSPAQRQQVLTLFATHADCVIARRTQVFCITAKNRIEIWQNLSERVWSLLTGDPSQTAVNDLDPGCGRQARAVDEVDPVAELVDAYLSNLLLEEEYAWLAPETTSTVAILAQLYEWEERTLTNKELERHIHIAMTNGADRQGREWLADQPLSAAVRMRVFQLRVARAHLVLERKLLALEAGSRKQNSIMLGLGEAFSKAWQHGVVIGRGVASSDAGKALEPQLKAIALVAATQKLAGDSMNLLITTPIQEILTEFAFKPVWAAFGQEIKSSIEKAWENHKTQADLVLRQSALLDDLEEHIQQPADAVPYLEAFARGTPIESPIGRRATTTLRSLLEDSDFIASTKGGLPWFFEAFAERQSQRTALLLHGAAYELEANNRLAAARVAAARGLPIDNPDLKITRASIERIFKPGAPSPSVYLSNDQLLDCLPVMGALWRIYNLPSKVVEVSDYLKGNIQDQDDFLEARVALQQSLQFVITALEAVDFDYERMASDMPWFKVHFHDHQALLDRSSEYAEAYRLIRFHEMEFEKRLVVARHWNPKRGTLSSAGNLALAAIQSRQDLECADLAVRAGYAKLVYHALTGNYAAAAVQTQNLEVLEQIKRSLLGETPASIDLSHVVHAFEAEAARREMVEIYKGLYESAVQDTVMRLTTGILSGSFEKVDPLEEVYKQINPWTGFFTEEGVFETLKVGFENTGKKTTAQVLANNFTVVNEADAELVLDVLYSVGKEVAKIVASYLTGGTPKHALARCEAEAREEALVIRADELVARQRDEIDPLVQRLLAIGDDPDFEFQREQLVRQIDERRRSLGLETIGAELAALSVDAAELRERSEEAEKDVAEASLLIAASRVEMEARNRRRDAADASDAEAAAAQLGAAAGSFAKLHAETVGVADLKDVLDDDHPAKFKEHLLRPELDIDTVRRALKRAKKNEPDRASEIDAIAKEIDQHRIEKVQELINEFMKSSGLADQVVAIVQGGAAEGNPEYQGIFGDIDFTLFVTPDATAEETARKTKIIKDRILAFFRDKDFPLATQEESSHMDAEAFVQAVGVMDVATSADGDLIVDTAIKRADVTRFYSEGGGKWAANNYAFSGKKLWGNFDREWIQVKPREAYGLALDMARHLGFLTDPRNAPEGLQRMSTEQKIEQLGGVLKDSKYFLRLVDAYLMGHEGLGNRLYNNRMHWRASSGEDASYHEQIAKDVEALVMPLGGEQGARLMEASADLEGRALEQARQSIFQQGDVDFIKQLARIKQKGENPDPWAVLPGSDAEAKAASAEALAAWMLHTAPKILAATAEVRQREQQRVMANGNTQEIRDLRNDTRRIATTVAAVSIYDAVGSRSLLHPPARMVEGQDEDGNPRVASQSLDRQQHETAIRQSIEAERRRRQRLHDEIVARQEAIRRQYPPNEALSDQDRQQLKAETQKVYVRVHGREQNLDEDRPGFWLLYWLPK